MNNNWLIVVACVVCGAGGYLLDRALDEWAGTPATIEASEDRAQQAIDSVATLLQLVDSMEKELRMSDSLSLAMVAQFNNERARFDELYPRIRSADARALHRITDSLLAGYAARRARYRLLLDSTGTGTR